MGVRVSLSALLSGSALSGSVRVSQSLILAVEALAAPVRVSAQYVVVARSYERSFELNLLDSNSIIYELGPFSVSLAAPPAPENNPYRPTIPESIEASAGSETYDYMRENQEILREQHNITQAGDSTFPYQMLIKSHVQKQFNLGAVGRFFHADYGIIQARYVQFNRIQVVTTPHCPVGLFKNKDVLDWVVTNRLDLSDANLVVGISAPWALPGNGEYGWVIVDGPNLQQIQNNSDTFALGEAFVWDDSGSVSTTAKGKVLGRRVNKTDIPRLSAGTMWIRAESFSEAQIDEFVVASTQTLLDSITALQKVVSGLPSIGAITTLQKTVISISARLTTEISARLEADLRINETIANLDFVTGTQLDNAIGLAQTELQALIDNMSARIDALTARVNASISRLDDVEGAEERLQTQLDGIMVALGTLIRLKRNRFPVVDGSVPPNLVYIPDGSLVWTEE
jgi:hypothetical protein